MELEELQQEETDVSAETTVETPVEPKRPKSRHIGLIIAAVLAAVVMGVGVYLAKNWKTLQIKAHPAQAVASGLEMVKPLPSPLSLGLLGQYYQGDTSWDFSGTVDLWADGDGLTLFLTDLTLAGGEWDVTCSGYLSKEVAILSCPALTGGDGGYYGVRLDTPLGEQAAGTGGDPGYGWYFGESQMAALQSAADTVSSALSSVKEISLTDEKGAFGGFVKKLDFTVTETATGYSLTAQAGREDMEALEGLGLPAIPYGEAEITVYLNKSGALVAVEVDGDSVDLRLDLGSDPAEELNPRLSATWGGDGSAAMLTLAAVVSEGAEVEPPLFENAFSLLPYIEGAVKAP